MGNSSKEVPRVLLIYDACLIELFLRRKSMRTTATMSALLLGMSIALTGCGSFMHRGAAMPDMSDIKLEFTVVVPESEADNFIDDLRNATTFRRCEDRTPDLHDLDPAKHPNLVDHLNPAGVAQSPMPYKVLFYSCPGDTGYTKVSMELYRLFTDTALKYAISKPEFPVRVLVDTTKLPEGSCPRNVCGGDGLLHHAPAACPCKYNCVC